MFDEFNSFKTPMATFGWQGRLQKISNSAETQEVRHFALRTVLQAGMRKLIVANGFCTKGKCFQTPSSCR